MALRGLFHRRDEPSAEAVAALPRDQRVVSWADTVEGSVVLATPAGLWWPHDDGPRLIDWYRVSKAVWHTRTLSVIEADIVDDLLLVDRAPVHAELAVPRDLPPVVRTRVEANVVRSELLTVGPGGRARIVARRVPGQDGLHWWARLEPGTRDVPVVRAAITARVAALRAEQDALRDEL